jgi:hypothetical protein
MIRLPILLGLGALLLGDAALADDDLERLAAAKTLWQSVQNGSYRYSYQKYCECYRGEPPTTVVTVTDGRIDDVFHLHSDSERRVPARDGSYDLYWTVQDLFSKLEVAYVRGAVVRVEFDPNAGYPMSLFIDYDPGFVGDETDLRLSDFERL